MWHAMVFDINMGSPLNMAMQTIICIPTVRKYVKTICSSTSIDPSTHNDIGVAVEKYHPKGGHRVLKDPNGTRIQILIADQDEADAFAKYAEGIDPKYRAIFSRSTIATPEDGAAERANTEFSTLKRGGKFIVRLCGLGHPLLGEISKGYYSDTFIILFGANIDKYGYCRGEDDPNRLPGTNFVYVEDENSTLELPELQQCTNQVYDPVDGAHCATLKFRWIEISSKDLDSWMPPYYGLHYQITGAVRSLWELIITVPGRDYWILISGTAEGSFITLNPEEVGGGGLSVLICELIQKVYNDDTVPKPASA